MTSFAQWLNSFFSGYDRAIFEFLHSVAEHCGAFMTPFLSAISLSGEKGLLVFLVAFILMLFKKSRKVGVCMFGAVCCGALITSITLKPLIERLRPFEVSELYHQMWTFVGAVEEDGFSFPSGHVTAAMSGMTALVLSGGKKNLWIACPYVILMGISRNYFIAHYPSDVLGAMIVGLISAIAAYFIMKLMFSFFEKHRDKKFFNFILEFDISNLFKPQSKQ